MSKAEIIARDLLGSELYELALRNVMVAAKLRSEPALIYGQRFITPASSVCRAAIIAQGLNNKANRRIVFLGDDDLTSVALSTILTDANITVIEIDKTLIDVIQSVSSQLGLNIHLRGHDLSQPLPTDLKRNFDCFVGDPYPTPDGSFEMWFSQCGAELLDPNSQSFGLVTFAPTHKFPNFRNILLRRIGFHFRITRIFEAVSDYEMIADELTSVEYEYLQTVAETEALISHSKSCVIISPKPERREIDIEHLALESWLASSRTHELVLRLGGEKRLESELSRTIDYEIWSQAYSASPRVNVPLNMSQILCDLVGNEGLATRLTDIALEGKVDEFEKALSEASNSTEIGREAGSLLEAARIGSVTSHNTYSIEFELYLLTRIYESYYRESRPTRARIQMNKKILKSLWRPNWSLCGAV